MRQTPSQTIGPFFGMALPWAEGSRLVDEGAAGAIRLRGRLLDGAGEPVADGLIEIWQADGDGRVGRASDEFRGFGRCPTDGDGRYAFLTTKPGSVRDSEGKVHAPHILVSVFARGLLRRVVTRVYFPDEANGADPVFAQLDPRAQATLVASRADDGYVFDIRLQGGEETVFFEP
jgi:protocatechuate 3,4-dioxygenase alpha subunit